MGLLTRAPAHGGVALTGDGISNGAELSLTHAVATFQDGRPFAESGDATPANTNRLVAVHFRRVALTRAKARVLRDALGVDLVAVEELAEEGWPLAPRSFGIWGLFWAWRAPGGTHTATGQPSP